MIYKTIQAFSDCLEKEITWIAKHANAILLELSAPVF